VAVTVRVGTSVERRPILAYRSQASEPQWEAGGPQCEASGPQAGTVGGCLIIAGVHGDEPKSVSLARRLLACMEQESNDPDRSSSDGLSKGHGDLFQSRDRKGAVLSVENRLRSGGARRSLWTIIPTLNPDGYLRRRRRNARLVDLNRNFPTTDWTTGSPRSRMYGGTSPASEPETRALIRLIECLRPARIVSIHSINGGRFCNNYDGPAQALAETMARRNRYPVRAAIGYPTPGSLGTWAGVERGIPIVTLELPSSASPKACWEQNCLALLEALTLRRDLEGAAQWTV
jgi:protein MpaA